MNNEFWKALPLSEMSHFEWESICDGCAKCCLVQLQDEGTEQLVYTSVVCDLLDCTTCQCTQYAKRSTLVPSCITMKQDNYLECMAFAPESCSYRLLHEGKELPDWHHLVSGDKQAIHQQQRSVRNKVQHLAKVNEDELEQYIVTWPEGEK